MNLSDAERLAEEIQGECRDQANALTSVTLAVMDLEVGDGVERDIFNAGIEAGITGALLALSARFDLTPKGDGRGA